MESSQRRRLKVLVVEDHAIIARLTVRLIEDMDCEAVGPAPSIREALRLAEKERPDAALVDLSLPDGSGASLISQLREMGIFCAVVSAYPESDKRLDGLADIPWLEKPLMVEQLQSLLKELPVREARDG